MAERVIEVITGRERRRRWSIEEKLRIVGASFEPGASVGQIAARHEVYLGLLFTWRRQFRDGKFSPAREPLFLPVEMPVHDLAAPRPRVEQSESRGSHHIEIELKDGSRAHRGWRQPDHAPPRAERVARMITPGPGVRIWLAAGLTDMRRGFEGLAALVQQQPGKDPFSGQMFIFRGKRGHLLKILFWDGQRLVLWAKRLERGRFVWPQAKDGVVSLTPAQLAMLTEGIDWRMPARTWQPEMAG